MEKSDRSFTTLMNIVQPYGMDQFFSRLILAARDTHELCQMLTDPRITPANCRLLARHESFVEQAWAELCPQRSPATIDDTELMDIMCEARQGCDLTRYYADLLQSARQEKEEDVQSVVPLSVRAWGWESITTFCTLQLFAHQFQLQCYHIAGTNTLVIHFETEPSELTRPLTTQLLALPPPLVWRENGTTKSGVHFCYRFPPNIPMAKHLKTGSNAVQRSFYSLLALYLRQRDIPVERIRIGRLQRHHYVGGQNTP